VARGRLRYGGGVRPQVRLVALQAGQPRKAPRCTPVALAEEQHHGGQEHHPYDGGVQQYRHGEADAHLLHVLHGERAEHGEDRHHDRGRPGDRPGRAADAGLDGSPVVQTGAAGLADPGDDEHVVVHGEAEQDHQDEERHPRLDRADPLRTDQ
jgi:hypothetical protein